MHSIQKLPEDLGLDARHSRVPGSPLRAEAERRDDATAPTMATGNPASLAKAATVEHTGELHHICRQAADTTHDQGTEAEHDEMFGVLHCNLPPNVVYTCQTVTVSLALECHTLSFTSIYPYTDPNEFSDDDHRWVGAQIYHDVIRCTNIP